MKNKTGALLLAAALSAGAFFMPLTVYAGEAEDTTPPVVEAELQDGKINIEATDEGTGIEAVYINGRQVIYSADSSKEVMLTDYATEQDSMIRIYAVDSAGNRSGTVEINNPLYREKEGTPASSSMDREQAETEKAAEEQPLTPDGQASVLDHAVQDGEKEFYTFETSAGNIFYLVVDRQRDSDNVYFLDAVTEDDLKALAVPAGETVQERTAAEKTACRCTDRCRTGRIDTSCPVCVADMEACRGRETLEMEEARQQEQPETEQKDSPGILLVLIAALAAGGAGYYLKVYKPRHDLDDAEDLDDLLSGEDEEEINEDSETEEGRTTQQGWENEPDMAAYDDYPEEEGEAGV